MRFYEPLGIFCGPKAQIFAIGRWEEYLYYNLIQFCQHQTSSRCPFNFRHFSKFYGMLKIFCGPKGQFFSLGDGRDTFTIILFNFINIRHYLGVLLILGIFEILWAAKDLLWPCGSIFLLKGRMTSSRCPFNFWPFRNSMGH